MEGIRKHLDIFAEQSEEDWAFFRSKLKARSYPKKSTILKKGQVENYLSYVEKGILRLYIPKIENDLTFGFVFPGELCERLRLFFNPNPMPVQCVVPDRYPALADQLFGFAGGVCKNKKRQRNRREKCGNFFFDQIPSRTFLAQQNGVGTLSGTFFATARTDPTYFAKVYGLLNRCNAPGTQPDTQTNFLT